MNDNNKIAIITDSGSDVSLDLAKELGIEVIPLNVNYKDRSYKDLYEITPNEVYDSLVDEIPTTSIPSPGEIGEVLDRLYGEGYQKFIIINISSGLSGMYQACDFVLKEKGYDGIAIDTKGIGLMSGVFALYAAKLRNEGRSFDEIKHLVLKNLKNQHGYFTIETLTYLIKGGRIGLVSGVLAGMLQLKPIISCNEDGIYYNVEKTRGRKRAIKGIARLVKKDMVRPYWLFLCEGQSQEGIHLLKEALKDEIENAQWSRVNQISPTLGIHTGPGLVGGILFVPEE
ncbi:MAG: DegV family protein [Tissierellia bacterium]|nr:DegV family protein [Tissierellia bacterium]